MVFHKHRELSHLGLRNSASSVSLRCGKKGWQKRRSEREQLPKKWKKQRRGAGMRKRPENKKHCSRSVLEPALASCMQLEWPQSATGFASEECGGSTNTNNRVRITVAERLCP